MNDRLEIASRLLAGSFSNSAFLAEDIIFTRKEMIEESLKCSDALIKLEQETRPREEKEEVLWMTEEPKRQQMVFYVDAWNRGKYFKAPWYRSEFNVALFEWNQVFETEAKIRKFLKLD